MALLVLTDGTKKEVSRGIAHSIWAVLMNEQQPSGKQQANYVKKVREVYTDYRHAPESYVKAHWDVIVELQLNGWRVDQYGQPVKPDSEPDWEWSRKYDLYEHGRLNEQVRLYGPHERKTYGRHA